MDKIKMVRNNVAVAQELLELYEDKINELVVCHNLLVKDYIRVLDRLTELEKARK